MTALNEQLALSGTEVCFYLESATGLGVALLSHELIIIDCNLGFMRLFIPQQKPVGKPISDYLVLRENDLKRSDEIKVMSSPNTGLSSIFHCKSVRVAVGYLLFCERHLLTESHVLELMGIMNNELLNLQRELIKKNAALDKMKVELEQRVSKQTNQLRQLNTEQQYLLNIMPIGICFTKDRTILSANPSFDKLFGYNSGETVGLSTAAFYANSEAFEMLATTGYATLAKGEVYSCEIELKKKDACPVFCNLVGSAVDMSRADDITIWMVQDITERKRAEEHLVTQTQRLQLATSSAHLGIWDWNVKENNLVWDDRMFELYGVTRESSPNSIDVWMNGLHPEDKEAAIAECQAALNGEKEFDTEFRVLHPDGTVKYIRGKGLVLRGADGTAERMLGINYDVTEAKQAEEDKHKLELQLLQAQKMESVGRLAGGVAHDFNNMLSVILGHAELGLMHIDPSHPVCADLKEISKTAERSADLTRQLLAFARKQTVAPKVLNLNDTITEMLKMLQRLIGEDIHLTWQPAPDLWQVRIDPSQIDQILANLCVNARDAIEGNGSITIETTNSTIDPGYCFSNSEATPGEYVCLTVSDSGSGMDKETQAHIFEPFYTTKELGKGTGLGLATVYGAVKQNYGFINIYSELGMGTTFSIYLPREESSRSIQALPGTVAAPVLRGQETILLVEDEPAMLNIASMMLENQGYTVLKADTPGEAVRLAREHSGEIQLLMTDVIMPEMNGRDLAKNLLSIYPNMKGLFMSGHTADVIATHGVLEEGVHFIQKPFSLSNMAAKVREVLGSK